jgi:hypothetical protein
MRKNCSAIPEAYRKIDSGPGGIVGGGQPGPCVWISASPGPHVSGKEFQAGTALPKNGKPAMTDREGIGSAVAEVLHQMVHQMLH